MESPASSEMWTRLPLRMPINLLWTQPCLSVNNCIFHSAATNDLLIRLRARKSMLKEFFTQRIKRPDSSADSIISRSHPWRVRWPQRTTAKRCASRFFQSLDRHHADIQRNSGFHLLTSWALRLRDSSSLFCLQLWHESLCAQTNHDNVQKEPPCKSCVMQSKALYKNV